MGGLHINDQAQVLDLDGHAIHGLFAAGEIVGGIHGADRLGSCATLDCLTFGRLAGRNAVVQTTATTGPPPTTTTATAVTISQKSGDSPVSII
jgi:succinate dehydrogenase/fumarate reductase flavoprotein subunit